MRLLDPQDIFRNNDTFHVGMKCELRYEKPQSQSENYITTDGQSASLSWYQATVWDPRPTLLSLRGNYLHTFAVAFSMGHPL
jgi:hypothetical protein